MDIACHTWGFTDLTLSEALGTIARMGFRCVDIGSGQHLNASRAAANPDLAAAEIAEDLALYRLKVTDLYLMLPRISAPDEDKRQKEIELFKALLPFAHALPAAGITLSPGLAQPAEDTEAYERTAAALREMAEAAKEAGIPLSIEPHLDSMAATPAQVTRLLNDVPGLALTLDWSHFVVQDIPHAEIARLIPKARHIQLRQAARKQLQVPFERGRIDIPRVVRDVEAAGYGGTLSIELMTTIGWHGMVKVNALQESLKIRDAVKAAQQLTSES